MADRVAVVTGATRGIGKAAALRLQADGARLVVCGRDAARLQDWDQPGVLTVQADVTDPEAAKGLVEAALNTWGRIDILVNNAGITRDGLLVRMSDKDWDDVLRTNLTGAFYLCRSAIRTMMKQRSGRIVNVSSVIGVTGNAGQTNYAASKAGLIGFTKALAKEAASRGVLVNAVAPGYIDTDMTQSMAAKHRDAVVQQIPLGRTGTPQDVAELVHFLASDRNQYITGQTIHVDGGLVI